MRDSRPVPSAVALGATTLLAAVLLASFRRSPIGSLMHSARCHSGLSGLSSRYRSIKQRHTVGTSSELGDRAGQGAYGRSGVCLICFPHVR